MVDHVFPPCQQSCSDDSAHASCLPGASNYSSFTYWRNSLPDVDDELAEFIKNRDASAVDKNADPKKLGMTSRKSTTLLASTTAKSTDHKSSSK